MLSHIPHSSGPLDIDHTRVTSNSHVIFHNLFHPAYKATPFLVLSHLHLCSYLRLWESDLGSQ